jgi:hypothetical protein
VEYLPRDVVRRLSQLIDRGTLELEACVKSSGDTMQWELSLYVAAGAEIEASWNAARAGLTLVRLGACGHRMLA